MDTEVSAASPGKWPIHTASTEAFMPAQARQHIVQRAAKINLDLAAIAYQTMQVIASGHALRPEIVESA